MKGKGVHHADAGPPPTPTLAMKTNGFLRLAVHLSPSFFFPLFRLSHTFPDVLRVFLIPLGCQNFLLPPLLFFSPRLAPFDH